MLERRRENDRNGITQELQAEQKKQEELNAAFNSARRSFLTANKKNLAGDSLGEKHVAVSEDVEGGEGNYQVGDKVAVVVDLPLHEYGRWSLESGAGAVPAAHPLQGKKPRNEGFRREKRESSTTIKALFCFTLKKTGRGSLVWEIEEAYAKEFAPDSKELKILGGLVGKSAPAETGSSFPEWLRNAMRDVKKDGEKRPMIQELVSPKESRPARKKKKKSKERRGQSQCAILGGRK